ncbi:protein RDM1-like [Herrania umbratica]|uniref:Protein RDM1-like n=1 Tax=Herrania umbratica TaxID=108875 RepID=A0A6J1B9U5_9ROSI|nr:protein RDM1-like [Herrania umbratica]
MLKRFHPVKDDHLLRSDSETESDDNNLDDHAHGENLYRKRNNREKTIEKQCKNSNEKEITLDNGKNSQDREEGFKEEPENIVMKDAKEYQEYMKQLPVPDALESSSSSSVLPFITWQGLAESMKHKYEQPLHYLTHILLKQWDESRDSTKNNEPIKPIGNVIHPSKAESTIWVAEEFNRQFASHHYLAKLWLSDPNYHEFVDTIIPKH